MVRRASTAEETTPKDAAIQSNPLQSEGTEGEQMIPYSSDITDNIGTEENSGVVEVIGNSHVIDETKDLSVRAISYSVPVEEKRLKSSEAVKNDKSIEEERACSSQFQYVEENKNQQTISSPTNAERTTGALISDTRAKPTIDCIDSPMPESTRESSGPPVSEHVDSDSDSSIDPDGEFALNATDSEAPSHREVWSAARVPSAGQSRKKVVVGTTAKSKNQSSGGQAVPRGLGQSYKLSSCYEHIGMIFPVCYSNSGPK